MEKVKITVFADPVCTWCWGSAPILRALEYRLGDKVEIDYVMGCMIEDITKYSNRRLGIGGDIPMSNRNIHKAWVEASAVHGMPVCEHPTRLFDEEHRSTAPQNMAYIAAKVYACKQGGELAGRYKRYLRRLQEATALDALHTCSASVLADLAAVEGFEPERFAEIMRSREVQRLYEEDKEHCRRYEVQTYPTFLLEYKGVEIMLRGFTSLETLEQNIKHLSYGKVAFTGAGSAVPLAERVLAFVERYKTAFPVELAMAFDMQRIGGKSALNIESYVGLPDVLDELVSSGRLSVKPRGNGFMVYEKRVGEAEPIDIEEVSIGIDA